MSGVTPLSTREQRTSPVVTVLPYVLLTLLVVCTVVVKRSGPELIDLGLCALAAVWMLWMITLHPGWRERRPVMAVFVAVLVVIMAVLVVRDP
jgi:hypothetical protein